MSDRLREAAQAALEVLESCTPGDYSTGQVIHPWFDEALCASAEEALRAALAEPKAEPAAYLYHDAVSATDADPNLHSTLLVLACDRRPNCRNETPLYTHQPEQRKPLTDDQIDNITRKQWGPDRPAPDAAFRSYARAVLRAAGIE